ncbi:GntR family transcriptional regulator [Bosea sp. WAO]|nr:GntR family transcriptional regulator [Bosea sp. WAO]
MPDRRPIRRRKLYEDVVERLETAINEGHYAPGDQLPAERELMEAYGVGRTAIREALFALQRMGLIVISSGERARVSQPSAGTMIGELSGLARYLLAKPGGAHHFQQARTMFEVGVARLAAETATADDIARLEAALAANRAALDQGRGFERTDVAFHLVLAEITRNPIFTALHLGLTEWLTEQRTTSLKAGGAAQAAYAAHQRIFEAVAARNPQAAADAMRAHLAEVGDFYWNASDL